MGFLSLFGCKPSSTPEQAFWSWFTSNEARLFAVEVDRDAVFAELDRQMTVVHTSLTFEFGPVRDGRREFVLSADGDRAAFPAVEALHGAAPRLDRWEWVKFRPRRSPINDVELAGVAVRAEDVRYLLAKDGERTGIVLFFDADFEAQSSTYGRIAFLLLDEALGEYTMETQVGFVDRQTRASKYHAQSMPLRELPEDFDSVRAARDG